MNEFELKDLTNEEFSDEKVMDWQFFSDNDKDGRWRLYFKPEPCNSICSECDKKHGFYFSAIEWAGNNTSDPRWGGNTYIEVLYHGAAYFDGLRHVYFGSEKTANYGYIYYPNSILHMEIWNQLKLLEKKYCLKDSE